MTDTTPDARRVHQFLSEILSALRESSPSAQVTQDMISLMAALDEDRTAYAGQGVYRRGGLSANRGAAILARLVGGFFENEDELWDLDNVGVDDV